VVLAVALCMISRWPLPNLRGKDVVTLMLLVGAGTYTAVLVWPSWWTVAVWNLWNVAIVVAAAAEGRREREA